MHEPHATESRIALGAGILAALVVTALLIFFLDEIARMTEDRYTLVIRLHEAGSLRTASEVQVAGKRVGRVTRVEFATAPGTEPGPDRPREEIALPVASGRDYGGPILATVELSRDAAPYVRRTSVPRVETHGLGGDAVINIMPGPPAPPLEPGDTLVAPPPIDRDRLAREARRLARDLDSLLASVQRLAPEMDTAATRMAATLAAIRTARAAFARVAAQYRESQWSTFMEEGEWSRALDRLRTATAALRDAWPGQTARIRSEGRRLSVAVTAMLEDADALQTAIGRLQRRLNTRGGVIGRLSRDSAIAAALGGVRAQLDSLMAEAKGNPLKFIF